MAVCKICGKEDATKPDSWINWECLRCYDDSIISINGSYSPTEKQFARSPQEVSTGDMPEEDDYSENSYP